MKDKRPEQSPTTERKHSGELPRRSLADTEWQDFQTEDRLREQIETWRRSAASDPVSGVAGHYAGHNRAMADAAERFLSGRDAPATPAPTAADIDAVVAARLAEAEQSGAVAAAPAGDDAESFAPIAQARALRSPPVTSARWRGAPLFVAENIPRLAADAGLPAPKGDHASLAESLFFAFLNAQSAATISANLAGVKERADALGKAAESGRKFLADLGFDGNLEELAELGRYQIANRSGVIRDLVREARSDDMGQAIVDAVRGTARVVIVAEGARKRANQKGPPGPRPKAFAPRLLEDLARHYRSAFGRWPYLKADNERTRRGGPALRWLRAVLGHVSPKPPPDGFVVAEPLALPFRFADRVNFLNRRPKQQPRYVRRHVRRFACHDDLERSVTEMISWTDETLGAAFEKATARAKRRGIEVPQG